MRDLIVDGATGPFVYVFYSTISLGAPADGAPSLLVAGDRETPDGKIGWHLWGLINSIQVIGVSVESRSETDDWKPKATLWIDRILASVNLFSPGSALVQPLGTPAALVDRGDTLIPEKCPLHRISSNPEPMDVHALGQFLCSPHVAGSAELFIALLAEASCRFIPLHYRVLSLMRIVEHLQNTEKTQKWMDNYDDAFAKTGLSTRGLRKAYPELRTRLAHGYNGSGQVYTAWRTDADEPLIRLYEFLYWLVRKEANERGVIPINYEQN